MPTSGLPPLEIPENSVSSWGCCTQIFLVEVSDSDLLLSQYPRPPCFSDAWRPSPPSNPTQPPFFVARSPPPHPSQSIRSWNPAPMRRLFAPQRPSRSRGVRRFVAGQMPSLCIVCWVLARDAEQRYATRDRSPPRRALMLSLGKSSVQRPLHTSTAAGLLALALACQTLSTSTRFVAWRVVLSEPSCEHGVCALKPRRSSQRARGWIREHRVGQGRLRTSLYNRDSAALDCGCAEGVSRLPLRPRVDDRPGVRACSYQELR
ncbi:hypothetical protein DFH09DRAFT_1339530 [Mycena vulgaris]|nr:hypothetical protein DFH09DRAFT_1339530 [Mycena vulgaris]